MRLKNRVVVKIFPAMRIYNGRITSDRNDEDIAH